MLLCILHHNAINANFTLNEFSSLNPNQKSNRFVVLLKPGGNVHIHYQEEKCYDEELFFYHLGCHQWVSAGEGLSLREWNQRARERGCDDVTRGRFTRPIRVYRRRG